MHRRGIDLDLAVLHIHTINTFRTEKYSRVLTLDIYLKREYICIQRYPMHPFSHSQYGLDILK